MNEPSFQANVGQVNALANVSLLAKLVREKYAGLDN